MRENQNTDAVIDRLVQQTGITRAQAEGLVKMLGSDWSSLIREARLIKAQPRRID